MAELAKLEPMTDGRLQEFGYTDEFPRESMPGRDLLVSYSGVAADEVDGHIRSMRDKAWAVCPYPCVGRFRFLALVASRNRVYSSVVSSLKSNAECTLLDMACCFGQDLRKLVADGVPSRQLYGADLRPDFINLGYELFRDRDSLEATFYTGNALAKPGSAEEGQLTELCGQIDYIVAASFLHLFSWEDQITACMRMVSFLKPNSPAVIFGSQMASTKPGNYGKHRKSGEPGLDKVRFVHNVETFKELWDLVGQRNGTKWDVKAVLVDAPFWATLSAASSDTRRMEFAVTCVLS